MGDRKQVKSYSLKIRNVIKVEEIAKRDNKTESTIIDKIIEEYYDGN